MSQDHYDQIKREAINLAGRLSPEIRGDFAKVRALVDEMDIVFALYPSALSPDGYAMRIVKGQAFLAQIINRNSPQEARWTAIPCVCEEQAIALQQAAGERVFAVPRTMQ